ncbi:hypothetical protein EXIGLDRAFT_846606 [Exidia glandulosa HHB12029]|uniref:Uncharacterized protein n=1 Tax=Exidia glandulosa HHB12029 TaxID=1314781 RepID=A0A165ASN4_EXIGL|nr:hypothetical protein EXIGLDRAFT_846606 [Exidia glandulosa HHB12029]
MTMIRGTAHLLCYLFQITRVRLNGVMPDRWGAILGHHLTALIIWGKFEPFIDTQLLRVIFLGCPKLQELLLQEYVEPPSEDLHVDMRMPAFTSHMPAPALRHLDIHSHSDTIATILASLSEVFIRSMSISTSDGIDFDGDPLLYDLMRGMSPLVSITVDDEQYVLLVDAV